MFPRNSKTMLKLFKDFMSRLMNLVNRYVFCLLFTSLPITVNGKKVMMMMVVVVVWVVTYDNCKSVLVIENVSSMADIFMSTWTVC